VRVGLPFMAALAFQNQRVLSELVSQFLDLEFARHDAIVAALRLARPSSIRRPPVLYECAVGSALFQTVNSLGRVFFRSPE
jgi:hypothetical protein